jgi:hypothetical protein
MTARQIAAHSRLRADSDAAIEEGHGKVKFYTDV